LNTAPDCKTDATVICRHIKNKTLFRVREINDGFPGYSVKMFIEPVIPNKQLKKLTDDMFWFDSGELLIPALAKLNSTDIKKALKILNV